MSQTLMSQQDVFRTQDPGAPTSGSWAARSVMRQVSGIEGGRVRLLDGPHDYEFGKGDATGLASTVRVENGEFYQRALFGGSLGVAESYLNGDWTCDDLTSLLRIFVRNLRLTSRMDGGAARLRKLLARMSHGLRANTRTGSRRNIEAHYDLGNEFFALFLDESMMYSSAVFENENTTLPEAAVAKIDRICRKLELRSDDHVVEIGTGWGGFAVHAARQYGCKVTTATISQKQYEFASRRIQEAGLEDRVDVRLCDYRDLEGQFDKLVSIEMIEAVGHKFLGTYFRKCSELLRPEGMMLLQGIVMPEQRYQQYLKSVDFIQRYIFPGGCLPSVLSMNEAAGSQTDLRMLHLEDLAPHYARTLECWRERFKARLDDVRQLGYDERFIRMWEYYLCYCEAAFRERAVGTVQVVFAKPNCLHDPVV